MPFVEATMIAGYGPEVKTRLATAFTRSVRSVMNAPLDGVIVVFREVEAANWVRGGVSRTPGPPLPAAVEVVKAFLAGDLTGAAQLADGVDTSALTPGARFETFTEAMTDNGSLVFAEGSALDGASVLARFHVVAGAILAIAAWRAAG